MSGLQHPGIVLKRLEEIDAELAERQNKYEQAAWNWFRAKRDRERARAEAFLTAQGSVAERNAHADAETALQGLDAEARYEALKAVIRVLETRASIAQSVLRSQQRGA